MTMVLFAKSNFYDSIICKIVLVFSLFSIQKTTFYKISAKSAIQGEKRPLSDAAICRNFASSNYY
ncbi:hypothetical protein [Flavobacterium sp. 9R]|uniref:hypothetical protein n=1 Tax=Flavobacterium sp. 9R TaxID=2653143 RepID=UPI00135C97F5|nr:hypothetical protein [Flavobacterium sp. 9R]